MKFSEALREYIDLKTANRKPSRGNISFIATMSDDDYYRRLFRLEEIMDKLIKEPTTAGVITLVSK